MFGMESGFSIVVGSATRHWVSKEMRFLERMRGCRTFKTYVPGKATEGRQEESMICIESKEGRIWSGNKISRRNLRRLFEA